MSTRFYSLAALTVLELKPHEMITAAAEAGYDGIGLRLIPATPDERHFSLLDDARLRRETLNRLRDTDVRVVDIEILRLKPETRVVDDFAKALELGAELDASDILVAGNDNDPSRTVDNFCALCELAQPLGLHPNLEFMPWTGVRNLSEAQNIVASAQDAGYTNASLLVDAFHLNRSASSLTALQQTPDSWLRYAQLCDIAGPPPDDMDEIIREARTERCFPGEGDIDLVGLLDVIPASLPLSLEIPTQGLFQQGISAVDRASRALASAREVVAQHDQQRS